MASQLHRSQETQPCPTPHKRGWSSKKVAKKALRGTRFSHHRDDMHSYLCECGSWHIGHKIGSLRKREEKKVRRAEA